MASLAEILAAKKAASAAAQQPASQKEPEKQNVEKASGQTPSISSSVPGNTGVLRSSVADSSSSVQSGVLDTGTITAQLEKPLTFAEKLALKKKQDAEKAPSTSVAVAKQEVAVARSPIPLSTLAASIPSASSANSAREEKEDDSIRANYQEIAAKIDQLDELAPGNDLKSAMADLKKALMANPHACELMLDEDVGKMVIALRRMVGEEMVAAKATKGTKKPKATSLSKLSADDILAGLDDL